jgi:hypothetical protein
MKWSITFSILLTTLLMIFQNCGKPLDKNSFNFSQKSQRSSMVENGYYVVVNNGTKPEEQIVDISQYSDANYLNIAKAAIQNYENKIVTRKIFKSFYAEATGAIQCGSVITSDISLSGTLDCSNYTGQYGLIIYGSSAGLEGSSSSSKFKLIMPQGKIGILVYGDSTKVKNVEVNGVLNGMGILVYDSNQSEIKDCRTNNNLIGIAAYAENKQITKLEIHENESKNNTLFGIRLNSNWSANKKITGAKIHDNDLSNNQYYALHIRSENMTLNNDDLTNIMTGSMNGWYLTGGVINIQNIQFTNNDSSVQKTQVFVAEATQLNISNVSMTGNGATTTQEAYGIHAYKISNINISNTNIQNYDVGIKVATEGGVTSSININSGQIKNNSFAAIMLQGYDQTQLCPIVSNITYQNNVAFNLWRVSGSNFCN